MRRKHSRGSMGASRTPGCSVRRRGKWLCCTMGVGRNRYTGTRRAVRRARGHATPPLTRAAAHARSSTRNECPQYFITWAFSCDVWLEVVTRPGVIERVWIRKGHYRLFHKDCVHRGPNFAAWPAQAGEPYFRVHVLLPAPAKCATAHLTDVWGIDPALRDRLQIDSALFLD